eukprot:378869-Prorocentrum_minimum.AAC.2
MSKRCAGCGQRKQARVAVCSRGVRGWRVAVERWRAAEGCTSGGQWRGGGGQQRSARAAGSRGARGRR